MRGTGTVVWESDDRLRVDGAGYVLMNEEPAEDELRLFKPRLMLEGYEPIIEEFQGANLLELGIYAGGSTAYLAQRCVPRRLVALDRSTERVDRLDRFLGAHQLTDRVSLHYGVDQADRDTLESLVAREFGGEAIDLVIDDASHQYDETVASFETLFPHVRPGGLYVIEDWTADDWLAMSFAGAIEQRGPMARAIIEAWVADAIRARDVVGSAFERWVGRGLRDPAAPEHDAITHWCRELDRAGAGDDARVIGDCVRACADAEAIEIDAPTLGTLGLQLLLAVKGLCPSIGSVAVTPFAILVRRGGPIGHGPFTIESIATDRSGVLASLVEGRRHLTTRSPD